MVFSHPAGAFWTEGVGGAEVAAAVRNRRKKVAKIMLFCLKSSFSVGFRSYIREFSGAILMLFRPSLPWCFPIRQVPFEQKESQEQEQQQQQQQLEEKVAKIIFFCGFQKLHWGVFRRNFDAFPSFIAMVFSVGGAGAAATAAAGNRRKKSS